MGGLVVMRHRSTVGHERRRSRRAAIYLAGHLLGEHRRWAVDVLELSPHGARVSGRGSFDVGDSLVLAVTTPAGALELRSLVVWIGRSRRRTAGVAFPPLSRSQLQIIEAAIFILEGEHRPPAEGP